MNIKETLGRFIVSIAIIFTITLFTSSFALLLAGLPLQEPIFIIYDIEASVIVAVLLYIDENLIRPFLQKK